MRITANNIENWAKTRQAQAELPIWIRKLILATNSLSELSMPGGDSVYRPGWDGQIISSNASSWVPEGRSVWEIGCNAKITAKANADFEKRTEQFDRDFQQLNCFVFVTPHRWHKKEDWIVEKTQSGFWKAIKVIDADNLEIWFENAPAVALEFGVHIGINGNGIESVGSYWNNWSQQCQPAISISAIQQERTLAKSTLLKYIEDKALFIKVEADSREEAIAFCCSVLSSNAIENRSACITKTDGWHFVKANSNLEVVILTNAELSQKVAPQNGLTIIQPVCHGDDIYTRSDEDKISIPRLTSDSFKKALIELGEEESDARRIASSSGRSWSVYRRIKAQNPHIQKPSWLNELKQSNFILFLLVGAWNSASKGDVRFIEALSGESYEKIEDSLHELAPLDDSPVINIGSVWKAKSPFELTYLVTSKLPRSKLTKFIELMKAIFSKSDPMLKLPENERWMANVYGNVRDESDILMQSLLNTLIRLKVYAETVSSNISDEINHQVDILTQELLFDASEERWMSLSSYLPKLAEASPDIFLTALEHSLDSDGKEVTYLIKNTNSGIHNTCWHSGLLWSLEIIAWNPSKLSRVTNILIELNNISNETNWGNTPIRTLKTLFSVFAPQTLATVDQKKLILERILKSKEAFAWDFIFSLIPKGRAIVSLNAKPIWRDDDAGGESEQSRYCPSYLSWLVDTLFTYSKNKPERIIIFFDCYTLFDDEFKDSFVELLEGIGNFDDLGKELILNKLRAFLSRRRSDDVKNQDQRYEKFKAIYDKNQPEDLIIKYRWLFNKSAIFLPEIGIEQYEQKEILLSQYRAEAIKHIRDELSDNGILELAVCCDDIWLIGYYTARYLYEQNSDKFFEKNLNLFMARGCQYQDQFFCGFLAYLVEIEKDAFLVTLGTELHQENLNYKQQVSLLACLPPSVALFSLIDSLEENVKDEYWKKITFFPPNDEGLRAFILVKFMEVERYNAAFKLIQNIVEKTPPRLVYELLQKLLISDGDNDPFPDSYWVKKAIEYLSDSNEFKLSELAILEFNFLPFFSDSEDVPINLKNELLSCPASFVEMVCLVYKPESEEESEKDLSINQYAKENAFTVVYSGRGIPGLKDDGNIDIEAFNKWIEESREIGRRKDRKIMVDQTIGQWISKCPEQEEGIWPYFTICELLEQKDAYHIRKGFCTGVYNNRGFYMRAYRDGGRLERQLAEKYKKYAENLINLYPKTASILDEIAHSYKSSARRRDDEVAISDELD